MYSANFLRYRYARSKCRKAECFSDYDNISNFKRFELKSICCVVDPLIVSMVERFKEIRDFDIFLTPIRSYLWQQIDH